MLWNTGYHKIICNKVKKLLIVIPIILISCANAYAKKYPFPEVSIEGVENPVSLAISHDGLRMVIIDWQKNGLPVLKESRRARIVNVWGPAFEINPINKLVNEGTRMEGPSFSFDGKLLLFAANFSDTHGGMDIYFSQIDGDSYTTPKNLGKPVNSGADENFASISGNNRELYFTREIEMKKLREYKTGELWTSAIKENSPEWSEPQKVNSIINDGGIAYPKVYDDNQTLLYSRVVDDKENWKIYWTREFNQIHWYLPVKIDTLASTESEVSPVYCKQDGFLYFIQFSNKSNPPKGNIYKYQLDPAYHPKKTIEIKGQIYDSVYNIPLKADVLVTNPVLGTTEFVTQSETESGNWRTLLLANENYMFQFWKKNYSHVYKNFLPAETQANSNLSVELTPHITLFLNTYDQEELWPLDVDVQIINDGERLADIRPEKSYKGRQQVILPIGKQYTLNFSKKDYFRNTLELNLSTFVLFDKFVRDIELKPVKRHLEIFVTEKDTLNPLEANIEFFDQRGNIAIPKKVYETPGLYEIILREGETFSVEVRGPKMFAFKHLVIDLDTERDLKRLTVELNPLITMVPIRLNNINFEFNSADLMENSFPELLRVVTLLKDNPEIYIELSAHTDDIGSDYFNHILAQKRARSVAEFLSIKGIQHNRMIARGYGEKMPLVPNNSDTNRAINRRVELKILDENHEVYKVKQQNN